MTQQSIHNEEPIRRNSGWFLLSAGNGARAGQDERCRLPARLVRPYGGAARSREMSIRKTLRKLVVLFGL